MPVRTSTPRIEVKLIKTMDRTEGQSARFTGAKREYDLTDWLGDRGSVSTTKAMGNPEGGFMLSFPDKPDYALADSLYGIIEPMDLIEIRASRDGGELPIIMRGFVSRTVRAETIDDSGQPQRSVIISGHDYGAVLRWCKVIWLREYMGGENPYLTTFRLYEYAGMEVATLPAGEFIEQLVDAVANKWLDGLYFVSKSSAAQKLKIESVVKDGRIGPFYMGGHEGDLWSLISSAADLGWNEVFVEDRKDGPWFVYRPAPFKDAYTGKLIMPFAVEPEVVKVEDIDIRSSTLSRGSERTVNWIWVNFPNAALIQPGTINMEAIYHGVQAIESPNSDPELFGLRDLTMTTVQEPNPNVQLPAEKGYEERDSWTKGQRTFVDERRDQLIAINKDNCVFEEGQLVLAGTEKPMVGKTLQVTRGSFVAEYYIVGVTQQFSAFNDWITVVQVERGTGFLERQKAGRSPFWSEGRPGAIP